LSRLNIRACGRGSDCGVLARGANREHHFGFGNDGHGTDGKIVGVGDAQAQTVRRLRISRPRLRSGAALQDVVRNTHLRDQHRRMGKGGRAHGNSLGRFVGDEHVEVSKLISPRC